MNDDDDEKKESEEKNEKRGKILLLNFTLCKTTKKKYKHYANKIQIHSGISEYENETI